MKIETNTIEHILFNRITWCINDEFVENTLCAYKIPGRSNDFGSIPEQYCQIWNVDETYTPVQIVKTCKMCV